MRISETEFFTINEPLSLDSGKVINAPVQIAYETYGELNSDKTNAILVCHALSGSSHAAYYGNDSDKPGWWDFMIGENKPIDTCKYFVICSNVLGSCYGSTGPSTVNPESGEPYRLDFPVVTINDMVKAQKKLIEFFKIEKLLSVVGGSMGGMQVLSWAVLFPEYLNSAVIIASTYKHNAYQIAFNEVGRFAIMNDPKWKGGNYSFNEPPDIGLSIARMIGHITYLSEDSMEEKFGRDLKNREKYGYDFSIDFEIGSYLHYQGLSFTKRFDANSYLYLTKALDYFDVTENYTTLEDAFLNSNKVNYLIVSFTSDWLYPPSQSKDIAKALSRIGANVSYVNINERFGHDSFLVDREPLKRVIKNFLKSVKI